MSLLKDNLITQAVSKVQQFASSIGKSVSNSINDNQGWVRQGQFTPSNFWAGAGGQALANVQQGLQNFANQKPIQIAPQVQNPVFRFAAGIPEGIINSPQISIGGALNMGGNINQGTVTPQNFLSNAAKMSSLPLTIATSGGGKAVAEQVGKLGLKQLVKQGAVQGAKYGAGFGALGGMEQLQNQDTLSSGAKKIATSTAMGAGTGALLGAGTSALGYGVNKGIAGYNKLSPIEKQRGSIQLPDKGVIPEGKGTTKPVTQNELNIQKDINASRGFNFTYKEGDKILVDGKDYIVSGSYLENGKPKYEIYTPGKKNVNAYKVTTFESNITSKNTEALNRQLSVLNKQRAELGRKYEFASSAEKQNSIMNEVSLIDNKIQEISSKLPKVETSNLASTDNIQKAKYDELISSLNSSPSIPEGKGKTIGMDIVPQTELTQNKLQGIKVNKQPIEGQQNSLQVSKVAPTTSKVSRLSISKKGKLNTQRLNVSEEQRLAIDQLQDNVPVTVIGNKDVVKQSVNTTGRKSVLTDDEMKVRLAQQLNTRQEVVSLSRQFENLKQSGASELELTALKSKIIDQSRIAQQQGTFSGRLLQSQNILANEMASPEQRVYALLENAGVDPQKYIKDAINVDFDNATQVVNFYRKYVPPKFGELLDEFRYTNMLSSPLTHIINTTSNLLQSAIVKPIEKTLTGGLDFVSSKLTGKERQYFSSQGIDYLQGYTKAIPQAWNKFKSVVKGNELSLRPDMGYIPTGTKGVLKWYTTPLRVLEASDQFFRTLITAGEKKSLGRFKLPESELIKRAEQSSDYTLFRQKFDPNGELGQGVVLKTWDKWNTAIQVLRRVPGGKWVVPFLQTPTNILKQGLEYSPLGVSTMVGAKRPLEQLSKAIIGTTVFASLYGIADKGGTTWDVPTNPKEKELFYAAGLQPYSVKIGDKWISYSKLGPLAYPMAMASALKWTEKNNPDQNVIENLRDSLGQMLGFFGDQSYVQSIGDLISAIQSSTPNKLASAVSSQVSNFAGQLVPYRSFQGWLARIIDPIYRKPEGIVQDITSQIPGLSKTVPSYTDLQGNPSQRDLPILNAVSPLKVGVEKPEVKQMLDVKESARIDRALQTKQLKNNQVSDTNPTRDLIVYQNENGNIAEVDLTKYDKIAKLPTTNKYETAIKESKQYSTAATLLDNTGLSDQQKQLALSRLGIDQKTASYYQVANDNTNLKTMYVLDKVKNATSQQDVITGLANLRQQVNGQMIASNAVLDNLVDEGVISKATATELKKYKLEEGKLTPIKRATVNKAKKGKKLKVSFKKPPKLKALKQTKIKLVSGKKYKAVKFKIPKKLKIKKVKPLVIKNIK